MSEATHTPGPWARTEEGLILCADGGLVFAPFRQCSEFDGNANLIAAAPEMLAMLKKIVEANADFRAGLPPDWDGDPLDDVCKEAETIIARAIEGAP